MKHLTSEIEYIPVTELSPHPDNPRKDLGDLSELADSIRQNGIMQNLTVVPKEGDGYTVIIGHRRLAAAKQAGLETVPCVVTDMDEKEQLRTMMMENMQRSDLTIYEQAQGFQLMLDMGDSIEDVSKSTGFSETTIRRRTKLLDLDQEKFKAAQERGATLSDYAELDKVSDPKAKNELLSVIGTENFKFKLRTAIEKEKKEKEREQIISKLQDFAKPYEGSNVYSEYDRVKYFYLGSKNAEIERPEDADSREYVYTSDNWAVCLYAKKNAESRAKRDEETVLRKQRDIERQNRIKALQEISNRTRNLRREFVENVGVRTIREHMKQIVSVLVYCALDMGVSLYDEDAEFFGIGDDTQEAVKKAITAPEKPILKLAYCALEVDENDGYFNWSGQHDESECLDILYELLTSLGYQMSDEEKALQDGSHKLFQQKETELDNG